MDPSRPASLYLRSTSTVSLHERFSQVLMKTRSNTVTSDPGSLQRRRVLKPARPIKRSVLTLMQNQVIFQTMKQRLKRRRSVWSRLGWRQELTRKPPGFWSFRNKHRWGARKIPTWKTEERLGLSAASAGCSSGLGHKVTSWFAYLKPHLDPPACSSAGGRNLLGPLGQNLAPGRRQLEQVLQGGGATSLKGRGFYRKCVPTKKQLDIQLDEYMYLSRSRLDQDLDKYMSMSRRRLDAQLDDYMLMAGQSNED